MPDNTYPVFESGQTLTATDLNLLRAFLHERDRLVGRMIGFGVNAGLGGSVVGTTLTIAPGLAVDQVGEPLVLVAPQTIALPPVAMTPSYDFISGTTGFSVVLEASETVDPAPACGEADCAGHAEHHTRGVVLRTVAGRLTGNHFDFSTEELLAVEPMRLGLDSAPVDSFDDLVDEIADRLENSGDPLIDPALITSLRSRSIATADSPAIKGYKAGWLNMVLFATLDLLRCEALLGLSANRDVARPGVVLGWVHLVGTTWVFECGYRHAWEPPRGFTEAFLGGSCTDPAGHFRDLVESIIAGWAPPTPPPSGGGPVDPPVHCPPGTIRIGDQCRHIYFPPEHLPTDWNEGWLGPINPLDPIWNPPFEDPGWLVDPVDVYGGYPIDFYGDGQIGGLQYVGQPGVDVQDVLTTFIDPKGEGLADVRLVTHAEAQAIPGYLPASSFSPSDTIVLSRNQAGAVVAVGRVAAVRNTQRISTALPAAEAALGEAQTLASSLSDLSEGLQESFDALDGSFHTLGESFTHLQQQFDGYQGGEFDTSGYGVRIRNLEEDVAHLDVGNLAQRISTLEGQLGQLGQLDEVKKHGERIAVLEGQFGQLGKFDEQIAEFGEWGQRVARLEGQVGYFGKEMISGRTVKGMSPTVGRSFAEFAETTAAAVRAMEKSGTLTQRYATDVERAHAQFEVDVASGDPEVIATSALGLMKSMRTMVKSAAKGTPEAATLGSQLDAQIREIEGMLG